MPKSVFARLASYLVAAVLLLAAGYLLAAYAMHNWARDASITLSLAALFILARWGYPRP